MGVQNLISKLKFTITLIKMTHTYVNNKRLEQNLRRKEERRRIFGRTKRERTATAAKGKTKKFPFQKTPTPSFDDDSPRFDMVLMFGELGFCKRLKKKKTIVWGEREQ